MIGSLCRLKHAESSLKAFMTRHAIVSFNSPDSRESAKAYRDSLIGEFRNVFFVGGVLCKDADSASETKVEALRGAQYSSKTADEMKTSIVTRKSEALLASYVAPRR